MLQATMQLMAVWVGKEALQVQVSSKESRGRRPKVLPASSGSVTNNRGDCWLDLTSSGLAKWTKFALLPLADGIWGLRDFSSGRGFELLLTMRDWMAP